MELGGAELGWARKKLTKFQALTWNRKYSRKEKQEKVKDRKSVSKLLENLPSKESCGKPESTAMDSEVLSENFKELAFL